MLDLTVSADINGVPIPMETRADLEAFYRVLGQYLRWSAQPNAVVVAKEPRVELIKPSRVAKNPPFGGRNPKPGERIIDYITTALEKSLGAMTAIQIMHYMEESGWKTRSKNPIRLIQVTLWGHKDRFYTPSHGKWVLCKTRSDGHEE